jgi:hypothetical protein
VQPEDQQMGYPCSASFNSRSHLPQARFKLANQRHSNRPTILSGLNVAPNSLAIASAQIKQPFSHSHWLPPSLRTEEDNSKDRVGSHVASRPINELYHNDAAFPVLCVLARISGHRNAAPEWQARSNSYRNRVDGGLTTQGACSRLDLVSRQCPKPLTAPAKLRPPPPHFSGWRLADMNVAHGDGQTEGKVS